MLITLSCCQKLRHYGITGKFYSLIKSYFENRHQKLTRVNNDYKSCTIWGIVTHGVLQGSVPETLLFLHYINDIIKITNTKDNNNKSKFVLFVADIGLIITSPNPTNFIKDINGGFININNWFKANLLPLNFEKTSLIQFLTKNSSHVPISVGCDNNIKFNITNIKFLEIKIDSILTWKSHIEMIIPKFSVACFVVTAIKPFVMLDTLKMVYHSYFHSIINYGIIF